ncbi:MAG: hypothetical protein OXE99_12990 [Cellvibrionales bacterium]|nr:hypothetical protein [Cellvibrionales bacterium]
MTDSMDRKVSSSNNGDAKADAIAMVILLAVAVTTVVFWLSGL